MANISLKIELDRPSLKNAITRIGSKVDRAQRRSTKRVIKRTRRFFVNEVYSILRLTKSEIRNDFTNEKVDYDGRGGAIRVFAKKNRQAISLARFMGAGRKPKRLKRAKGLKVKVYRGSDGIRFPGTWAAYGKDSGAVQIFMRQGKKRKPLKKLSGPGPREVFNFPGIEEKVNDYARTEYQSEFAKTFQSLQNI